LLLFRENHLSVEARGQERSANSRHARQPYPADRSDGSWAFVYIDQEAHLRKITFQNDVTKQWISAVFETYRDRRTWLACRSSRT